MIETWRSSAGERVNHPIILYIFKKIIYILVLLCPILSKFKGRGAFTPHIPPKFPRSSSPSAPLTPLFRPADNAYISRMADFRQFSIIHRGYYPSPAPLKTPYPTSQAQTRHVNFTCCFPPFGRL
jgi:hypothetical protein